MGIRGSNAFAGSCDEDEGGVEGKYERGRRKINDFLLKVVPEDSDQKMCVICIVEFEKGSRIATFPSCKI